MTHVLLYWHTLKYLKPVQFWYRLWYYFYKPKPGFPAKLETRPSSGNWQRCARADSIPAKNTFRFLNQAQSFSDPVHWHHSDVSELWQFNTHYFDDLNATDAHARNAWHNQLIERWIVQNPAGKGVGWHPYPTSLRIVNWVKWLLTSNNAPASMDASLPIQANYLCKQLEYHIQGNHLWANAKALIFAGVYYQGEVAERWFSKGTSLLRKQLQVQILSDGGHFERSPMYHGIILEDLLDLLQLSQLYPSVFDEQLLDEIQKEALHMFSWLDAMCHPDGEIAYFNDATSGIAPTLKQLRQYATVIALSVFRCPEKRMIKLSDTGYMRIANDQAVLIADVGEIGPRFQPGHAHADTLSFELSLFQSRLIVNCGIDRYGSGKERLKQRGTSSHSTVEVDGENSSEVWSGFRVARRAHPIDLQVSDSETRSSIACGHDGYRRLRGDVIHRREWSITADSLEVNDKLEGSFSKAVARFFLHPDVRIGQSDETACLLTVAGKSVKINIEGAKLKITDSSYHPGFNLTQNSHCLELLFSGATCLTRIQWNRE